MYYHTMTNDAIAAELGSRLERLRLEKNISQQALAGEIGITPKSYRQLIAGSGKLENLIAALRALDCLQQLDNFLPEPAPSPLLQLKLKGKERLRARSSKHPNDNRHPGSIQEPKLDW